MWQRQIQRATCPGGVNCGRQIGCGSCTKTMSACRSSRWAFSRLTSAVQIEIALLQRHRQALQGVVEGLRDAIEVGRSGDDFPAGVDPQLLHERDHPAQDFGHAAAAPRGVDVDDPLAGQPLGQPAEPLHLLVAHDLFIAVQQSHGALLDRGGASAA